MKCISVNQLYSKWLTAKEKGEVIKLVDVREVGEYAQAHVPGAELIALNTGLPAVMNFRVLVRCM